jgi:cytochrome bd ubiquinol oxidase subunit II
MTEHEVWATLAAVAALVGVIAYALLGGADFGGGVWDLFAGGSRGRQQRLAIQQAMGPVWEANHVWLIFVIVVLFTCFPRAYAALGIALFLPFHLALVGIMLRGASFVFRSYQSVQKGDAANSSVWGTVFGVASIISPVLLGCAFGVITEGQIRLTADGEVKLTGKAPWLSPYCVTNGLLALSTCAYLAAVYLTNETEGELRNDFRARAILAGTTTAMLAALVLLFAWQEAEWFFMRLFTWRTFPVVLAGLACFAGSAWSVFTHRYALSRLFAASEIALVLVGWGLAQYPYLVYPDMLVTEMAAPTPTLRFMVLSIPVGALLLAPSLWLLMRVFKARPAGAVKQP